MNYKKLELKLRRIVEKRLREGWLVSPTNASGRRIHNQDFDVPTCCLVGALELEEGRCRYDDETDDLEHGFEDFDRENNPVNDEKVRAIGARIRRDYYETTDEAVS